MTDETVSEIARAGFDAAVKLEAAERRIAELEADNNTLWEDLKHTDAAMQRLYADNKRLREALEKAVTECSTFPIKEGLAFRVESILRAALTKGGENE